MLDLEEKRRYFGRLKTERTGSKDLDQGIKKGLLHTGLLFDRERVGAGEAVPGVFGLSRELVKSQFISR